MTDLYDLLTRAIDSQPEQTPEARLAVYNHIRGLYERQRQSIDPNLPDADILSEHTRLLHEQAALETVIARIEAERSEVSTREETLSFDRFAESKEEATGNEHKEGKNAEPTLADMARERPRVEPPRKKLGGFSLRHGVVIAALIVAFMVAGAIAWWLHSGVLRSIETEEARGAVEAISEKAGKVIARVSGEPPPDITPNTQPLQVDSSLPGATAQAPDTSAQSLAQKAFLFEIDEEGEAQPKISAGQVLWRIEGAGSTTATLYADGTIQESGLSFSMAMRLNDDPALPASHIIEITFKNDHSAPDRIVRDVAMPQLRIDNEPRGVQLAGLPIPVADNIFLVGLSNVPSEITRNIDLLKQRDWVDLPLRFISGEMGTVTFAKGSSGQKAIEEALASWK